MTPSQTAAANRRITALASDRAMHRAFHWFHLHESHRRRWHREFLAIPAPPFAEAARAEWFAARFAELGLTTSSHRLRRQCPRRTAFYNRCRPERSVTT